MGSFREYQRIVPPELLEWWFEILSLLCSRRCIASSSILRKHGQTLHSSGAATPFLQPSSIERPQSVLRAMSGDFGSPCFGAQQMPPSTTDSVRGLKDFAAAP
jgi:hypothetical protein